MKMLKAKYELKDMLPIALTLVAVGVATAYGINIVADLQTSKDMCATGTTWNRSSGQCCQQTGGLTNCTLGSDGNLTSFGNASQSVIEGVAKLPSKLPLLATVVVAAIIIGVLLRYLVFGRR